MILNQISLMLYYICNAFSLLLCSISSASCSLSSVDDGLRAVLFGGVRAGKPEHTKLCVATLNYFSPFFLISTMPCDGTLITG